ncbi:MAG: DNA mismatch repair endonuclease MutL [Deltaproteobacteria bacterium]|nr:DNA mismatch repair endonuclease MutL [Deltaproteobacteria bacterium]
MSVIRVLSEKVASQIAAGEVIERPASIARELIDNSIDAGANLIDIRIEKGGKSLIKVKDNGVGMDRDDLLLCVERHATSKINDVSDLLAISTMGFRGEALPSIAAVSRLEITARTEGQIIGHRIRIEGGKLKTIDEIGTPKGTVVEVRDLFFNTPARKKFLRSSKTEADHILDTVSRIALPFGNVYFRLSEGDRPIITFATSENEITRLATLFGKQVAASMEETLVEIEGLVIRAYLAPPDFTRSRGDRIYLYVNRRNVRDRLLTRAIMEGYGQRLMKGRYPYAILFIDITPDLVDINVHPTKQELRFRNGQTIYQAVVSLVGKAMAREKRILFGYDGEPAFAGGLHKNIDLAEPRMEYSGPPSVEVPPFGPKHEQDELLRREPEILGQLRGTYILCQVDEGLLMVDQHAAHERIIYEKLKESFRSSRMETQYLLIPHQLDLSPKESKTMMKNLDQLAKLGFEMDHFGGTTFLLRSVPSILVNVNWNEFIVDLVTLLEETGGVSSEQALDRFLIMAACHGAIKAGRQLSRDEMRNLIKQLETLDLPTNCPHGRPALKRFSYREIEKMFKRVP